MKKLIFTVSFLSLALLNAAAQTTAKEWYDKGNSLKQDAKYADAVTALKKAVSLDGSYKDALHLLGWCYNELGQYDNALKVLKKEATLNPVNKAANNFEIGYAYEKLKQYDDAIAKFTTVIGINNQYSLAFKERGNCYYKKKDYEKALDNFDQYTKLASNIMDPDFFHDKGWCENELGKYDDAVTSLNQSITLDDSYIDAYSELGYAYYKLSKNDEAIANYRTAMNMSNGQNYRYILNLANVYYTNLKNYDSAIVYFEKGLQLQNEDKNAYYKLGWCYNDKKQYDKAISPLQKALILDPDFINAKTELGYANYKLDRYDAALVQFQAIMKKNPDHELSRYYAGFCYYLKNDQDNLKKMIDELTSIQTTKSLQYADTLKKYVK